MSERDLFGGRRGEYELPAGCLPTRCLSCQAEIVFIPLPSGKRIPLSLATIEHRDGKSYALSHWVDCPDAKEWRRS